MKHWFKPSGLVRIRNVSIWSLEILMPFSRCHNGACGHWKL